MNETNKELSQYHTDLCVESYHQISVCRVSYRPREPKSAVENLNKMTEKHQTNE